MQTPTCRHFLPVPYPDECLYSLLCRYHVRSGNTSIVRTKAELFGNSCCQTGSSILAPSLLKHSSRWLCSETLRHKILLQSTAFQLAFPFLSADKDSTSVSFDREFRKITQHLRPKENGYLRYCPTCARLESSIYGEPYWHLSHQIRVIHHCPVHGSGLIRSNVSISSVSFSLMPAFASLTRDILPEPSVTVPDSLTAGLEKDYRWLLLNGIKLKSRAAVETKCFHTIRQAFREPPPPYKWIRLFNFAYLNLFNKYRHRMAGVAGQDTPFSHVYFPTLRVNEQLLSFKNPIESGIAYMRLVYGGTENFYRREYLGDKNTPVPYWHTESGRNLLTKNEIQ